MLCETEIQEQWQQQRKRNRMEKTGERFTITINCVHVLTERNCVQTLDSKLDKSSLVLPGLGCRYSDVLEMTSTTALFVTSTFYKNTEGR